VSTKTPPSIEKISIWILEVLDEERQREPDLQYARPATEVLGVLKTKHGITDAEITRGLNFCIERQYIKAATLPDGAQVMLPSVAGVAMHGLILKARRDEQEKKKWSRSDKIALASFAFSIFTFFGGLYIGRQNPDKSTTALPPPQQTNSVTTPSQKSP
jgi:hypothetical protein